MMVLRSSPILYTILPQNSFHDNQHTGIILIDIVQRRSPIVVFSAVFRIRKEECVQPGAAHSNYNEKAYTGERPFLCFIARFARYIMYIYIHTQHIHTLVLLYYYA